MNDHTRKHDNINLTNYGQSSIEQTYKQCDFTFICSCIRNVKEKQNISRLHFTEPLFTSAIRSSYSRPKITKSPTANVLHFMAHHHPRALLLL